MAGRLGPNNAETRPEKAFDPRPGDRRCPAAALEKMRRAVATRSFHPLRKACATAWRRREHLEKSVVCDAKHVHRLGLPLLPSLPEGLLILR